MRNIFFIILFFCFLLHLPSPAFALTAKATKEGNNLYHQGKYDEAIKKYNEARDDSPDSDIINFNLGAALYKKGRYQEAVDAFTKALNTENKEIEQKAVYNMANSKYELGNSLVDTDSNSAVSLYRESLDYYKRAIELDKNDRDARYNYNFVEKKLKELFEKIKNQSSEQRKNQEEGKRDRREGRESQAQHRKKQDDKQQQRSQNRHAETAGAKDKQAAKGKDMEEQSQSSAGEESREMSPEEARMLLDVYGREEAGSVSIRERRDYHEEVLKNW
jgi:Ca-activated chloride channel family protein